ncbi:hypothetical protein Xen7305DRAFT_00028160 [Xenococcus sp. PCC 7305]|uniref:hypothetical protein n=1 Tax=Xenococcus sp. PCC 7305 TaxID=102125 RepID=UPI0002ABAD86|nr:hypothetical protein [Xenococcus sp. PCC 7305]ELS03096.1 hypothetical protein Xen7305DRAFT_00028160 [Xenococcus sp. PCC 7305]
MQVAYDCDNSLCSPHSETSPTFPKIPLTQLIPKVIERSWQVGASQALEEFEATINGKNAETNQGRSQS